MRFWSKLANWLNLPEPYEHLDGWVFDGERVFADTLCQTHDRNQRHGDFIPAAGSDWWYSPLARKTFPREEIFDSQREAVEHALEGIDRDLAGLCATRERIIHDWKGHLKAVDAKTTPSGDPPGSSGRPSD